MTESSVKDLGPTVRIRHAVFCTPAQMVALQLTRLSSWLAELEKGTLPPLTIGFSSNGVNSKTITPSSWEGCFITREVSVVT